VSIGISRWVAEGEELFQVGVGETSGGLEFAPRRIVEHLTAAHQSSGKRPFPAGRSARELNQVGLETALLDRE